MNAARSGAQLGVLADAIVGSIAGAGGSVEVNIGRGLNLVIDADVVIILVAGADAHNVAGLLDGRIGRDPPDLLVAPAPSRLHPPEDMDLIAGAVREVNVSRASRDR